MLAKENRIKKNKDFGIIFKKGKRTREKGLTLNWSANGLDVSRFGFIVSKKVSKKATVRNKIKRRLREIVRGKRHFVKKGMDCALIANPGLEKENYKEISEIIEKLFKRAGLLKRI